MNTNDSNTLNLLPAIRSIEEQIRVIESDHRKKIAPYQMSLDELRKINTACETCGGSGQIFKRVCAEDDGSTYLCSVCCGTGVQPHPKE